MRFLNFFGSGLQEMQVCQVLATTALTLIRTCFIYDIVIELFDGIIGMTPIGMLRFAEKCKNLICCSVKINLILQLTQFDREDDVELVEGVMHGRSLLR